MLVGREDELALVDALLAHPPGRGAAAARRPGRGQERDRRRDGQPGGATGAHRADHDRDPSETEVPYTSLQPLLWPVLDDADGLPAAAARGVGRGDGDVRGAAEGPVPDGHGGAELLGDAAERAPVVVVAEDAHWLDEATTEVLAFVARRIEADAITILVTSRETIPRALRGLPSRTLAPL